MVKQSSSNQRNVNTATLKALVVLLLLSDCYSKTLSATTLDPSMPGFLIIGNSTDNLGSSVKTAGDVDNDGYSDIIVGAWERASKTGAAYVIYGGPKSSMSDIDLSKTMLDPATTGFMVSGNPDGDYLGWSVSTAGDINNDGYDDIIIGGYKKNSNQGAAYVIYGGPKSSMSNLDLSKTILDPATTGFMITLPPSTDIGNSVSTAGDVNNDGYDDIIIGVPSPKGIAYVIYGGPKSSMSNIDLSSTTLDPATTGFMLTTLFNGISVGTAGDVNHDGYDDIIVGVSTRNMWRGAAYVIYGGPKSSMSNIDLQTTILDPQTIGFMITGGASFDELGSSVSTAGDINNDGFGDIIVGARRKNGFTGAAYVIYGGPKSSMSDIALSTGLDPATTGFMISGDGDSADFGSCVSTAGDMNNDGYDDIIIGAWGQSSRTGAAYVIYGGPKTSMSNIDLKTTTLDPATTGFMMTGNASNAMLGSSVSTTGDINHDGYEDVIIGSPGLRTNNSTGGAYVIYGGEKPTISNVAF